MRSVLLRVVIFLVAVSLLFTGCSKAVTEKSSESSKKPDSSKQKVIQVYPKRGGKPVLLFDLAHREVFSPDDESGKGQKRMFSTLKSLGFEVIRNEEPFTPEILSKANVVYIPGAMAMLSEEEIASLKSFVENGGCLLVAVHVNFFLQPLIEVFGFQITNSPICQTKNTFHSNAKDFVAPQVVDHEITKGISGVAVMGTWGIREANEKSRVVVYTDDEAWADLNGNDMFDNSDIKGKFGVIGVAEIGKGKVVVSADDAVFSNALLGNKDNETLVKNIVKWFIGETGEGSI